jgi:hypothetical protein
MIGLSLSALAEHAKLNRDKLLDGMEFSDLFGSYLRGLQED